MESQFTLINARPSDEDLPLILQDVGRQQCTGSYSFGPCTRNNYLIHYIIKGHGTFHVGERSYSLGPGDGFVIFPFVPAYYVADEHDPWEYCWAGFSGRMSAAMIGKIDFTKDGVLFHNSDIEALSDIFDQMHQRYEQSYNLIANAGWLYLLLAEISRPEPGRNESFERMVRYIERNYMYAIDMKQFCRETNLCHSQVYRLFIKYANQSPQLYILNYRLDRAQELLSGTNMNITDISSACGFSSVSYFSKSFRQKTGYTPNGYRKYAKSNIQ